MLRSSRITVGTAAVQLAPLENDNTVSGFNVVITNRGTASIFLGGDNTVTTATGYEVSPGTSFSSTLDGATDAIWAISTAAGQRADVLRVGVQ